MSANQLLDSVAIK